MMALTGDVHFFYEHERGRGALFRVAARPYAEPPHPARNQTVRLRQRSGQGPDLDSQPFDVVTQSGIAGIFDLPQQTGGRLELPLYLDKQVAAASAILLGWNVKPLDDFGNGCARGSDTPGRPRLLLIAAVDHGSMGLSRRSGVLRLSSRSARANWSPIGR